MRRVWLLVGVAIVAAACSDAGLVTSPGPAVTATTSSSGNPPSKPGELPGETDGGTEEPEGWGDPETVRRPGKLRVQQLNVRRFFDTMCDSGEGACPTDFEEVLSQSAFDRRVQQLADGFAKVQPDVITLAEVEKQECLDAVQAKLKEAGFEFTVAYVAETGPKGSMDVAILARGKLGEVKNWRNQPPVFIPDGGFTRQFPEIHLTLGKSEVIVFPAHFRSKSNDVPEKRLAEAKAAHEILVSVAAANEKALVVLGGDLNDTPDSEPLKALEDDGKLLRVASDIDAQGTFKFGGNDQAIDHIFTANPGAYVPKSALVERDSASAKGFAGSDHATIWADFNLPK